jgi:glycosyltransferase involved in cell wall biosynthesis
MKVAYFCEPQVGGTFSFFKRMRPLLARQGIEFRCISPWSGERLAGTRFEHEEGLDDVRFPEDDLPAATEILVRHLTDRRYDAVIVLPGSDILAVNLVRYLPRGIRTAARVPMITRGAYAPAKAIESSLDLVFAVSHRVTEDLSGRYGIPAGKIRIIYNGVDVRPESFQFPAAAGGPFRLLYSGRLSDLDKGVLLLPDILRRVRADGVDAQLTLAGTGPDEDRLRAEFARLGLQEAVHMPGNVTLDQVENLLSETDCFLLPSRFEGCPNALLEAMAAGCACVASRIAGSVERIVEDGRSGLLAPVADTAAFARLAVRLAREPAARRAMGAAARQRIEQHFSARQTAEAYVRALLELQGLPDRRVAPLPLERYTVPRAMRPTWRTRLPPPVKNFLRKWMERMGISA